MAASFLLTASVQVPMQLLPLRALLGCRALLLLDLLGGSPECPHSLRQLARQPNPPSITWVTLPSMETPPLVSAGTCSVTHPSLLPWSRGKIVTKNQPGCYSLRRPEVQNTGAMVGGLESS